MEIEKNDILYERDEKGELIPEEVPIEIKETSPLYDKYKNSTIWVTPLTRGEIKKLKFELMKSDEEAGDTTDIDGEIILKHCFKPKFEKKDIPFIKPEFFSILLDTIFRESGIIQSSKSRTERIEDTETEFKKN